MGHTWREMEPGRAEAHDRFIDRLIKAREVLADVPLSEFTAGDLEPLYRVMRTGYVFLQEPSEEDLQRFEKRLPEFREKIAYLKGKAEYHEKPA